MSKALRKSALDKLQKLGLTEEEVLSLLEDEVEEVVERKSWQQLVMEEHLGYYNKQHGTSHSFEEYYEGIVNGDIQVHYDWKKLLGISNG